MEFLLKYNIKDRGQLAEVKKQAEDEIAVLVKQRQKLYRREPGVPQIAALTSRIKQLRKTVGICKKIKIHSLEIEQRMQAARAEEQSRKEKERSGKGKFLEKLEDKER